MSGSSCLGVVVRHTSRTTERTLARLATASHGVVTRTELLRAGITEGEIRQRLLKGALLGEHPGVYRVGHRAPSVDAGHLAAVKACGGKALLGGRAAGYLHRLLKGRPPPPSVTAPTERRVPGVLVRRSRRMHPGDATTVRGIPVTTVAKTLVDLAAVLALDDLARACHEAGVLYRTTPAQVEAVLAHQPSAPGAANLRRVLNGEARVSLSALEKRFLGRLAAESLVLPVTNRPAGGRRVDCRWPELRLTVELDSYRYHASRHAWEKDHRREREARARGDDFRRYTYGDVFEEPELMMAELRGLLAK